VVKHIVMFKLNQKSSENMERALTALKSMGNKIETLKHLEVGINFKESERSYDLVLTTHFDNKEGLESYANHPVHQPVIKILRGLCSHSIVVDYETDS